MNNFKKIGLTALAGSLVATSVFAGEMSVAGGASFNMKNFSNVNDNDGKKFSMGNQLTFTGGGEMDNGMNVSLSFILDQGDNAGYTDGPFDSHSLSVGSDAMGTITFAGEGASSAQNTIDTTAAGDIWDNTFTYTGPTNSNASNKTLLWALPTFVDGLDTKVSYTGASAGKDSQISYALTYSGIEGASISYGFGETGGTKSAEGTDVTTMKASFAFGPVSAAMSINDYAAPTGTASEEQSSYKVSYSVTDELSISYGSETHETTGQSFDEEFSQVSVAYTTGGLTISASQTEAENATTSGNEESLWNLGLSFAF
ncbi:porin [Candidatus Pelagibacter sp.]|nr:porin [Candidatus Pelagibacter sp.]